MWAVTARSGASIRDRCLRLQRRSHSRLARFRLSRPRCAKSLRNSSLGCESSPPKAVPIVERSLRFPTWPAPCGSSRCGFRSPAVSLPAWQGVSPVGSLAHVRGCGRRRFRECPLQSKSHPRSQSSRQSLPGRRPPATPMQAPKPASPLAAGLRRAVFVPGTSILPSFSRARRRAAAGSRQQRRRDQTSTPVSTRTATTSATGAGRMLRLISISTSPTATRSRATP